jgi:hypothetical protein
MYIIYMSLDQTRKMALSRLIKMKQAGKKATPPASGNKQSLDTGGHKMRNKSQALDEGNMIGSEHVKKQMAATELMNEPPPTTTSSIN